MDQRLGLAPLQSNTFAPYSGWPTPGLDPLQASPLKSDYFPSPQLLAAASNGDSGQSGGGPPLTPEGKIDLEALSKQMDNPLGNLWILWMQNDTITIKGFPLRGTQTINATLIQPIMPVPLTKDWLWVNRPVLSLISAPVPSLNPPGFGEFPGLLPSGPSFEALRSRVSTDRKFEFGDMIYLGMLAPQDLPKVGDGQLIWGFGPTFIFPTATHDFLGSGKYSAGPGGIVMYLGQQWKFGGLAQQWVSFAGDSDRPSVSKANIQPIIYRDLPNLWQVGMSPNILVNWEASGGNKLTLPLGLGVNKTTLMFGKLPVRVEANVYYAAVHPDDVGQRWTFRFVFIPIVPNPLKAMGIDSIF